jgi:hypothetical protein
MQPSLSVLLFCVLFALHGVSVGSLHAVTRRPRARFYLALVITVIGYGALTDSAFAVVPEFFSLPAHFESSWGISAAPDGSVWFPANEGGTKPGIARLIPSVAVAGTEAGISVFPTPQIEYEGKNPCCASFVRSVAVDAHERVWFSQDEGIVGYAEEGAVSPGTSSGMHAARPVGLQDFWDIAIAPTTGLAWVTEQRASNVSPYPGDRIASIDQGLNIHELGNLALQGPEGVGGKEWNERYESKPEGITVDANGKPWFAEANAGLPGYRIATAPAAGSEGPYSEYLLQPCFGNPCSGSNTGTGPSDVAVAPDGSIWFTNELRNEVGRLDPAANTFENFSMAEIDPALAPGIPRRITAAPDGTIWVSESGYYGHSAANALVRIVPSQPTPTATVYELGKDAPIGLAADTKGNMWFTTISETNLGGGVGRLAGVVVVAPVSGGEKTATPTPSPGMKTLTPVSIGTAKIGVPRASGGSVTVEQICLGPPSNPCAVVYLLSAGEYVTGFPGAKASAAKAKKKKRTKAVILGRTAVTLHGGQKRKVTVTLNAKGRKLLKSKGKLTVFFTATQEGSNGTPPKLLEHIKVTFHAKHH